MNLNGMGQLNNQQVPQIPIPQQPQEQETKVEVAPPEQTPVERNNTEPLRQIMI